MYVYVCLSTMFLLRYEMWFTRIFGHCVVVVRSHPACANAWVAHWLGFPPPVHNNTCHQILATICAMLSAFTNRFERSGPPSLHLAFNAHCRVWIACPPDLSPCPPSWPLSPTLCRAAPTPSVRALAAAGDMPHTTLSWGTTASTRPHYTGNAEKLAWLMMSSVDDETALGSSVEPRRGMYCAHWKTTALRSAPDHTANASHRSQLVATLSNASRPSNFNDHSPSSSSVARREDIPQPRRRWPSFRE